MSCQTAMYSLKPIISLPSSLYHSKTMYEMRNIHEEQTREKHTGAEIKIVPDITEQTALPEFTALEARQEKILAQLAELRKQVSTLCGFLKQTNQTTLTTGCEAQEPVNVKLIINVNPRRPPYSILALHKIWKDADIRTQTYLHSSVTGDVPNIFKFNSSSSKSNIINISLIWKEVDDLQLICGLHGYPIIGETNVLRYLSRLLSSHNYENSTCLEMIGRNNFVLDLCHCLNYEDNPKKRQEILSLIADKLTSSYTGKEEPTIADVAAWSTIKQVCPKKYPASLNKWFDTCEKLFT